MADYTVIVDDNNSGILYGPNENSWSAFLNDSAYQGTLHHTASQDANLNFSFIGGREIFVRGKLSRDSNCSESTTYPTFLVDWQATLGCSPDTPESGNQFLCSSSLPSNITNRTLTMFVDPDDPIQGLHIDFIRYGSSRKAAVSENGTVMYAKAPDNTTLGLSFNGDWKFHSIGGQTDFKKALCTSTASSSATYNFTGNSFGWWACCMPAGTSTNVANVTYRIDGGDTLSVQLDKSFIQGTQCNDESLLFDIQPNQIQSDNHTLEVVYHGDYSKMPLTLCALAATPVDFKQLDIGSNQLSWTGGNSGKGPRQNSRIIVAGVISGVVIVLVILSACTVRWKRKQAKFRRPEELSTDSLSPFPFHPAVGFIDPEKQNVTFRESPPRSDMLSSGTSIAPSFADEQDRNGELRGTNTRLESSQLGSQPPSYHTTGSQLTL